MNPLYVPASASPTLNSQQALDEAIRRTNGHEGGYADVAGDAGGKTAAGGLTEALARQYGYKGDMRFMTLSQSLQIIVAHCWNKEGLTELSAIAPYLAMALYDVNVNFGPGRGAMWVQQALNALNAANFYGQDLLPDGKIGTMSRARIQQVLKHRGAESQDWLIEAVIANRMVHYITRCNTMPDQRKFAAGWMDRIVNSVGEY